jgi:hypothetical protein
MTNPGNLSRLLALALGLPVLLPACMSIGVGSVHRDRLDYSGALTSSYH